MERGLVGEGGKEIKKEVEGAGGGGRGGKAG